MLRQVAGVYCERYIGDCTCSLQELYERLPIRNLIRYIDTCRHQPHRRECTTESHSSVLYVPGHAAGRVRCWKVQCREPKTGQQKVQLYYGDDPLCPSRFIIYLCCQYSATQYKIQPTVQYNTKQNITVSLVAAKKYGSFGRCR